MSYYCFLCNENHEDSSTEEHFIPRSIDCPEYQWLPVCESSNTRSNLVFDNDARDVLYWVRFKNTRSLKRTGLALLADGTTKKYRFSYLDKFESDRHTEFSYIFDRETNEHIPSHTVSAIVVPVGLLPNELTTYCRGMAKISLGAIAYLLIQQQVAPETIKKMFSQPSVNVIRHIALGLPWPGRRKGVPFSFGRSDVLELLHHSCKNRQIRNHVVKIYFKKTAIHVEGMLYSQYGWRMAITNHLPIESSELRLENPIDHLQAPERLQDLTMTSDAICIANPEFPGPKPNVPPNWRELI